MKLRALHAQREGSPRSPHLQFLKPMRTTVRESDIFSWVRDLRVRELLELARAGVEDAPAHLQKMYDWHFERSMTTVKATLGGAASIAAAVAIAYWKAELKAEPWQPLVAVAGALASASYGLWKFRELRSIHREYVAALALLRQFQALAKFLRLYRGT